MKLNRKSLLGLLALGFLVSCTQSPQEKVRNATVHITRERTDRPKGGSGFFIEPDQIVTNIHVVAGPLPVYVTDIVGTEYVVEGVIGSDPKYDLVILKVSGKGTPLALGNSRIGEPIFVAGYPLGGKYEVKQGTVHGVYNSGKYILLKIQLLHGNSGGPVANRTGEVIGVTRSVLESGRGDSFGFAISSRTVRELLDRLGQAQPRRVQPLDGWREEDSIRAYWYADLAENTNDHGVAIQALDKSISLYRHFSLYSDRAEAKFRVGELEADRGNTEKAQNFYNAAIIDLDEAIKLNPEDAETYLYSGAAKLRVGELEADRGNMKKAEDHYNAAIIDLDEAIELIPDFAEAYFLLGTAKFCVGELENDRGNMKKAQDSYDAAIIDLDEVIKLNPDSVEAYLNSGAAKFRVGELEADRGNMEKAQDSYDAAIIDLDEVIKLNPEDAEVYFNRGLERAHFSLMEADGGAAEKAWSLYDAAVKDWNKAIELNPDRRTYYIDEVIIFLDRAIKFNSDSARFYYSRGLMKKARGRQKEAGTDLEKAKALDPDVGR